MKTIVLILVIVFTFILTGVLYGKNYRMMQEEYNLSLVQAYMQQYPITMPDVIFDPVMQVPLY